MKEDAFSSAAYLKSQDCYFYYYSSCIKGDACPFRHEAAARDNEVVCRYWAQGSCTKQNCHFRHMEIVKPKKLVNCYWETQPSGCLRAQCPFVHSKDRSELLLGAANMTKNAQSEPAAKSTEHGTTDSAAAVSPNQIEIANTETRSETRGEYPLPRKDLRKKTVLDRLTKKHLLEQQLYVLQMKQKAAEELEAHKKQMGLPLRRSAERSEEMMDEQGIPSPSHWRLSGEVGSSSGSPVSASPVHVSPMQTFVLNLADDDSDSDMDYSFSRARETNNTVKSLDEIRLQKVQAEQESLVSYTSFGRPATIAPPPPAIPATKPSAPGDLREKILRNQQQKLVKEEVKRVKEEVRIKTIEEIRAERAMREQGKVGNTVEKRVELKRQAPLEGVENVKRMRTCKEKSQDWSEAKIVTARTTEYRTKLIESSEIVTSASPSVEQTQPAISNSFILRESPFTVDRTKSDSVYLEGDLNSKVHRGSDESNNVTDHERELLNTSGESEVLPEEKSNDLTVLINDQETSLCKTDEMECEGGGDDCKNLTEGNDVSVGDEFDALFPD